MPKKFIPSIFILFLCFLFTQCEKEELLIADNQAEALGSDATHPGSMKKPEGAGNCLSFPVIWAEGETKYLPGTFGEVDINGEWWYWWGTVGTDPNITPLSCPPDPDDPNYCDDGIHGSVTGDPIPFDNENLVKAFVQKDPNNRWQAESADWSGAPLNVHWIDWGDNLESVDWYTRSQVRTEVVLFQDLATPMTEYQMRHTSGWGINEVHGLAATVDGDVPLMGLGDQATVYSPCARFMIQKLNVDRDDPALADLTWTPEVGWENPEGENLINVPIFNKAVHEALDGPGYYNAEINVKGRIIYGYTWNVRKLNEGAGDYRLTFSFDDDVTGIPLNTFFIEGVTEIIVPLEEELLAAAAEEGESPGGGAEGVLDFEHNLTYMDIRILERSGGGNGGGGGSGGGGKGGGRK